MDAVKLTKLSNTNINKLNWRLNHIFFVITDRDRYLYGRFYKPLNFKASGNLTLIIYFSVCFKNIITLF